MDSKGWQVDHVMDANLNGEYDRNVGESMLLLAQSCLAKTSKERPSSDEISITLGNLKYRFSSTIMHDGPKDHKETGNHVENLPYGISSSSGSSDVVYPKTSQKTMR